LLRLGHLPALLCWLGIKFGNARLLEMISALAVQRAASSPNPTPEFGQGKGTVPRLVTSQRKAGQNGQA
jgi:hypothetical protein